MTVEEVSSNAATKVLAAIALYEAGKISAELLAETCARIVYAAKVVAARLADIVVSTAAGAPPVGVAPDPAELERLQQAFSTIAEEPQDVATRAERVAVAEPLHEHRKALQSAMRAQGFGEWERVVEDDACEACEPLRGEVHDIERGFTDHPGCRCSLRPHGDAVRSEKPPEPTRLVRFTKQVQIV